MSCAKRVINVDPGCEMLQATLAQQRACKVGCNYKFSKALLMRSETSHLFLGQLLNDPNQSISSGLHNPPSRFLLNLDSVNLLSQSKSSVFFFNN